MLLQSLLTPTRKLDPLYPCNITMSNPKTLILNPPVKATPKDGKECNEDEDGEEETQCIAHRLPCTVHFNGALPTARAFCPLPEPLTAFRGRRLQNGSFEIPPNYKCKSPCFHFIYLIRIFWYFISSQIV